MRKVDLSAEMRQFAFRSADEVREDVMGEGAEPKAQTILTDIRTAIEANARIGLKKVDYRGGGFGNTRPGSTSPAQRIVMKFLRTKGYVVSHTIEHGFRSEPVLIISWRKGGLSE